MNNLQRQIDLAKKSIRREKSAHPYYFEEYRRMIWCKQRIVQAKEDYRIAKETWDNLGR